MSRPRHLVVLAVLVGLVLPGTLPVGRLGPPAAAWAAPTVRYEPPVPGRVLRGFEPQAHEYGPGHRGVDLEVAAGTPVRAAAGGTVTFAGTVAGRRWVTVQHPDGVRTSYGALVELAVAVDDEVVRGDVLAAAAGTHGDLLSPEPGLHWSARRGERYLDPLTLLDAPLARPTLVGEGRWWGSHPVVDPYDPYPGGSRAGVLAVPSPEATRRGFARAPNHHRLLQLPGYATEGPSAVLDASYLGYDPDDVAHLSYRGCEPTPDGCLPRPYGGQDTDLTPEEAARLLDQQLRAMQREQPHRPVDLIGHSMGGDVLTTYLAEHYDPHDLGLPPIGHRITVATPHHGAGSMSPVRALGDAPVLGRLLELLRLGAVEVGIGAAGRVSFRSAPLDRYGHPSWRPAPGRDEDRLRSLGIPALEIAGSRDLMVGPMDAAIEEAYVLPGGHHSVRTTEAFYESLHRFLRGADRVPIGRYVGGASQQFAELGRLAGDAVDALGLAGLGTAAVARNGGRLVYEGAKLLVGPAERSDDPTRPEPLERERRDDDEHD